MSQLYRRALAQMDLARSEKISAAQARRDAFYRAHPQLDGLQASIAAVTRDVFSRLRDGQLSAEQAEQETQARIEALRTQHNAALAALGVCEDDFAPVWDCPLCQDTGYIQHDDGRRILCDCVRRAAAALAFQAQEYAPDCTQCFEAFDPSLFPDMPDPFPGEKHSQRRLMQNARDAALQYADGFQRYKSGNFMICGQSGLGKTYLAHCIANRVQSRGFSVLFLTAYRLFGLLRNAYFDQDDGHRLEQMLCVCDLLILDDLGSEPLQRNISLESLFSLLNERSIAHRATLVVTNLSLTQLRDRYGERISSRLMTNDTPVIRLYGEDVRIVQKRRAAQR